MLNQATALPDDALELLKNFQALPEAERARILALVRNLRALAELVRGELQLPITASALA